MGSEVFDDVAFYYVSTAFIASLVVPITLWLVWKELSVILYPQKSTESVGSSNTTDSTTHKDTQGVVIDDKTGVNVDKYRFVEQKLKQKNILTTTSFAEKYFKKRYLLLVLGWIVFIWLLTLAPTMQTKDFVVFEPYSILGIELDATEAQIKRAYRKLAMMWHPDKHPTNKEEAENKFTMIAKAYAALTDPRVKANMERFGNPDGIRSAQSMTYGLPEFLSSKNNELYVLIGYFLLFVVLPPTLGYLWWKKNSQFHDTGVMNQTIGWYAGALNENMNFNYIIEPFAIAAEFRQFNDQKPEKIEELKRLLNGQVRDFVKHRYDKIYYIMVTSVCLHAYMQRIPIDKALAHELDYILSKVHSLAHVILELSKAQRYFHPAMAAIDLMQNATQGMWTKDSPLLQLPHITPANAEALRKKGVETIADFRAYPRAGTIKILGCSEAQYEEMAAVAKVIPVLQVEVVAGVPGADDIRVEDIVEVEVALTRRDDVFINEENVFAGKKNNKNNTAPTPKKKRTAEEKAAAKRELEEKIFNWEAVNKPQVKASQGQAPLVLSNTFPHSKREVWYVMLVYVESAPKRREVIVDMRTLRGLDSVDKLKFLMRAPEAPGVYAYEVHVRCDSYVGCDVVKRITMKVDPVPVEKPGTSRTSAAKVEVVDEDEEDLGEGNAVDEEEDDDEEEEEEEVVEQPGKWYYLGAPTFFEFVLNMVILSVFGYFIYNYLHSRGIWQKFVEPVLDKVWAKAGPTVMAVHAATEPVTGPIVAVFMAAVNRFLGVDVDLPMEVKIDKLNKARGKGMF